MTREPGIIHHLDQGEQYAPGEYLNKLRRNGFEISMAQTGNPYENTRIESFFKTLKHEAGCLCEYETIEDVMERLPYSLRRSTIRRNLTQP